MLLQHQRMAVYLILQLPAQPELAVVGVKQMRKLVLNVLKLGVLVYDMRQL